MSATVAIFIAAHGLIAVLIMAPLLVFFRRQSAKDAESRMAWKSEDLTRSIAWRFEASDRRIDTTVQRLKSPLERLEARVRRLAKRGG